MRGIRVTCAIFLKIWLLVFNGSVVHISCWLNHLSGFYHLIHQSM